MRVRRSPLLLLLLIVGAAIAPPAFASDTNAPTAQQSAFFESKIRPLLIARCFNCHSEKQQSGDLRLDSIANILKGNAGGPVVVPGDPEKSRMILAVRYNGKIKMPPSGRLEPLDVAALEAWVKMGAPWPTGQAASGGVVGSIGMVVTAASKDFWSFKPVKAVAPPNLKNDAGWCRNAIDKFVLAGLRSKGLKPATVADRRTLIRRAYFDLIGLPPTPEQVDAFLRDRSPGAWSKVVDQLLASTHYGERWGRRWLDVARYADSNGLDENLAFGNAWRYRDYVVNSFNRDKPYTQFVTEELAGDLMPSQEEAVRNERLTATGFLCLGPKVLAEQDKPKMVMDIVDEQIEVTSKAFLGLTVACARCHDHKFDPIPTKDYYALAGIFKSTKTMADLGFVSHVNERPLTTREMQAKVDVANHEIDGLKAILKRETDRANAQVMADFRKDAKSYLLAGWLLASRPSSKLTTIGDLHEKPGDPKRLVIEAENFDRGDVLKDFDGYGKGIGVIHTGQPPCYAEWDVTLPAGTYQLEFRYAAEESRPVKLSVNGKLVNDRAAAGITGSWNPDGQRWEAQGVYAFNAGKNTIKIQSDSAIPHFDKLLLVSHAPVDDSGAPAGPPAEQLAAERHLDIAVLRNWERVLRAADGSPLFSAWAAFAKLPANDFESQAEAVAMRIADGKSGLPVAPAPAVARMFAGYHPTSLDDLANRYAELIRQVDNAWTQAQAAATPADRLEDPDLETVRKEIQSPEGISKPIEKPETRYSDASKAAVKIAADAVKKAQDVAPKMPEALAVDEGTIQDVRVHIRGNTLTLGDQVSRGVLQVVSNSWPIKIPADHSGRLELAQWITRPDNPLTARVEVNRIWQGHFGDALVRTPDNFGLLGDRPTYPELLDWLAHRLVANGWSVKSMHRLIMNSATYRMGSDFDAKAYTLDPDNRLLWRANRRRLEAEPLRDAMLAVSGRLDPTLGGSLLTTGDNDYVTNDQSANQARYGAPRRSIYMPIIRNALFDMFLAFDYGDPSTTHAQRADTTVAPQALWIMNSPFSLDQSKAFADTLTANKTMSDTDRIRDAYQRAFARPPSAFERDRALDYLTRYTAKLELIEKDADKRRERAWTSLCHILFASNEFIYLN